MISVAKHILNIRPYIPGKPIEEVKRELNIKGEIVKLASNENPLGPSPLALKEIRNFLKKINYYPDGSCFYLKEKISKKYSLDPSYFLFGNGSNELLDLVSRVFIDSSSNVVIGKPSFVVYKLVSQAQGAKIKEIPLTEDFSYNLSKMAKVIDKDTRVIFIGNPNNPTGKIIKKKEFENFLANIPKNVIVAIDEAYYEYVEDKDYPDTLSYIKDGMKNLLVFRTFSKIYGLAGLRIGYLIAHPEIISFINKIRQPFNVNVLAQIAAASALDDKEHIEKSKKVVREGKIFLYKGFEKLKIKYIPSEANFILFDVNTDSDKFFEKMLKRGIIVRPMKMYNLPTWIRVTIGLAKDNKKFLKALKKVING